MSLRKVELKIVASRIQNETVLKFMTWKSMLFAVAWRYTPRKLLVTNHCSYLTFLTEYEARKLKKKTNTIYPSCDSATDWNFTNLHHLLNSIISKEMYLAGNCVNFLSDPETIEIDASVTELLFFLSTFLTVRSQLGQRLISTVLWIASHLIWSSFLSFSLLPLQAWW